jgi:hypothetical protein
MVLLRNVLLLENENAKLSLECLDMASESLSLTEPGTPPTAADRRWFGNKNSSLSVYSDELSALAMLSLITSSAEMVLSGGNGGLESNDATINK